LAEGAQSALDVARRRRDQVLVCDDQRAVPLAQAGVGSFGDVVPIAVGLEKRKDG